ncbi:MAG: hypothetical protein K8R64_04545 [Methanosarcinaceae archaeon]|nr:hypothetical protein [Methanosarcinaceae archaeon]
MKDTLDEDKLEHLLGHWIEHNESHSQSFNDWAEKLETAGFGNVAEQIRQASARMDESTEYLRQAKISVTK